MGKSKKQEKGIKENHPTRIRHQKAEGGMMRKTENELIREFIIRNKSKTENKLIEYFKEHKKRLMEVPK